MQLKQITKKNIIVYIRRGPLELEWICPILEKFYKSKYNIYFYFKSKNALDKVKKNQFYFNFILKIKKKIKVNHFTNDLFLKIIRFLFKKIKIMNLENNITEKLHSFDNFIKKIDKNLKIENISYLMTEYGNNDYTIKKLYYNCNKKKPKIIHYPSAPAIHEHNIVDHCEKIYTNCLFLPSEKSVPFWEQKVLNKFEINDKFGLPQFNEDWMQSFKDERIIEKKRVLIALNDVSEDYKKIKNEYKNFLTTINILFNFLEMNKNDISILVKLHPHKTLNFEKILDKKINFHYLNESFMACVINSDIIITSFNSSASIYGSLLKKPVISIQNHFLHDKLKNDLYTRLGFSYSAKDDEDLLNKIDGILKRKYDEIFNDQVIIGKKYFNTDKIVGDEIYNEILKL